MAVIMKSKINKSNNFSLNENQFKSLNCKSNGAPTASSSLPTYTFIIMGNKLKENNMKLTFSFLLPSSSQPGGDHAPTLETHLSSTVLGILTVCYALVKHIKLKITDLANIFCSKSKKATNAKTVIRL